ncbi:MAG: AAA family ATPase [Acidimicrobiales bacterium]
MPGGRRPLALWDRVKLLLLLSLVFVILVWAAKAAVPIEPLWVAAVSVATSTWWLVGLASIEVLRQAHYLLSEHWPGWHRLWTERVFGRANARIGRMPDWTRFRLGRVLKWLLVLVIADLVLAKSLGVSPAVALFQVPSLLAKILPLGFLLLFYMVIIVGQFAMLFWFLSKGGIETYFPGDVKTRFSDVWGQDAVLERVKENIIFLRDPESIEERGGYVPGGILLWGPPGTGKTLMAEAVAGETNNPFVFVEPAAFTNMFMGVGVLKVKSLFRRLRKLALRYGGVVVFFDEADSLGNRGSLQPGTFPGATGAGFARPGPGAPSSWQARSSCGGLSYVSPGTAYGLMTGTLEAAQRPTDRYVAGFGGGGSGMGTLEALLAELSGLKKPRGFVNRVVRRSLGMQPKPPPKYRILVMMATNMPESLDEAMLRPGRIDRIYKVGYPSKEGRLRTYRGYLDKVAHELSAEDIDKLATITPYATGAVIKDLVNEALINTIREGRQVITWRDMIRAKHLKELGPPEDVEYVERERHAVAVHEACHAVAAALVRHHLLIDIATIEKGGNYLGMVAGIPPEDSFTSWRSEYEADVMVALASLVGERLFFDGDSSSGVFGDLESATRIATMMEGYWGMGTTMSVHGVTHQVGVGGSQGGREGKGAHDAGPSDLGPRIEAKLEELAERVRRLLEDNRGVVLAVAHALETNKTMAGEDVLAVVHGRKGPLVDGRPYLDPVFAARVADYHDRVTAIHKQRAIGGRDVADGSGTGPPMPPLPPVPPVPEPALDGAAAQLG